MCVIRSCAGYDPDIWDLPASSRSPEKGSKEKIAPAGLYPGPNLVTPSVARESERIADKVNERCTPPLICHKVPRRGWTQ